MPGPHVPRLGRTFRLAIRDTYDSLGLAILASIFWSLCVLLPASAASRLVSNIPGLAAALVVTAAGLAAANAGVFHIGNKIATRDEPAALDLLVGVRLHFWRSLGVLAIWLAGAAVLSGNTYFYFAILPPSSASRIMGVVTLDLLIIYLLATIYIFPLTVQHPTGVRRTFLRSALLALDNPGFTIGLVAAIGFITALLLWPVVRQMPYVVGVSVLFLLFVEAGFAAILANHAALELMRKYEHSEPGAS